MTDHTGRDAGSEDRGSAEETEKQASVLSAGQSAAMTWIWFGLPFLQRARTA